MRRKRPGRRPPYLPPRESQRLYLSLPGSEVGLFRFLLEGYGHLACMTVVDRQAAVVRLLFAPGSREEVLAFADAAAATIAGLALRFDPLAHAGPGTDQDGDGLSPP
jgi:hypothetical protein